MMIKAGFNFKDKDHKGYHNYIINNNVASYALQRQTLKVLMVFQQELDYN